VQLALDRRWLRVAAPGLDGPGSITSSVFFPAALSVGFALFCARGFVWRQGFKPLGFAGCLALAAAQRGSGAGSLVYRHPLG
jgi:hypothetical protein